MHDESFKLKPQRQRLQEEPVVLRTVDWRTLRTAAIETEVEPGAGEPAPEPSDDSDASEDDPLADF